MTVSKIKILLKTTLSTTLLGVSLHAFAGDVYVNGYYRSDGTYVQPHYRTSPNNTTSDNYSMSGNTNPYTGQTGSQNSYSDYNSSGINTGGYLNHSNRTDACSGLSISC